MGQSVSTDIEPSDLKSLFKLGQAPQQPPPTAAGGQGGPLWEGGARHHLKAWKFEKNGRAVVDSPAQLCDENGHFGVELERTCSYLILHVHSHSAGADEPATSPNTLEELAAMAGATCTPRGLSIEVVTHSEVGGCDAKGSKLSYSIFVWHGASVDPYVKARIFTKAFELDRLLRVGLLWQPAIQGSPGGTVALRGRPEDGSWQGDGEVADAVRRSSNRLLSAILEGPPQVSSAPNSLLNAAGFPIAGARDTGAQRFPLLGLSVCRSLGVAPAVAPPVAVAPPSMVPAPAPVRPATCEGGVVPRLPLGIPAIKGLGGLSKRDVTSDEVPASMDIDSTDSGRKRGRGPEVMRLPLRSTTNSGIPSSATVPKSARTDLSLPLQSPRSAGQSDSGDLHAGFDAHGRSGPPVSIPPGIPLSDLEAVNQTRQQNSIRTDAPAMLNLEEINMSEEELIRTYDPDNEENNYHLPHHLYKKLQLERYRPECSEVIKNSLFISSHQVSGDIEALRRHGITHIVNTARDVCNNHFPGQFNYLTYYLKDTNNEDISTVFYRTLRWIDDSMQRGGRVLVHCREGVSRSSTIIIAYLMWRYAIPFETAHERIRRVRPICNPNTGFTCQLLVLGKRLGLGGGNPQAPSSDVAKVHRVGPYHPNEPFLLLLPPDLHWSTSPSFDPRFGYVVQRGLEAVLWIGSQVADVEATQSAVREHLSYLLTFERLEVRLSIVQDGLEPPQFWQHCGLSEPPADRSTFTVLRPAFDADADTLVNGASTRPTVDDNLQLLDTTPREDSQPSSTAGTAPAAAAGGELADRPLIGEMMVQSSQSAGPPSKVPPLALGGLLNLSQPAASVS